MKTPHYWLYGMRTHAIVIKTTQNWWYGSDLFSSLKAIAEEFPVKVEKIIISHTVLLRLLTWAWLKTEI